MTQPQGIPLAPAPTITTEDGRTIVAFHARCLGCGYDLHGLYVDARCPECAQPVSRSLMGNLYRFCTADFVAKVQRGVLIALVGTISIIPMVIAIAIVGQSLSSAGISGDAVDIMLQFFGMFAYIAILSGWWLMSTPDPGVSPSSDPRSRRFLRLTILIAAVGTLLDPLWLILNTFAIPGVLQLLMGSIFVLGQIAKLLQWFAAMSFARIMAKRLESQDIGRFARFLWWAPIITLGVVMILGLFIAIAFAVGGRSSSDASVAVAIGSGCFSVVGVLIMVLVLYVTYAVLLGRMHQDLSVALASAQTLSIQPPAR